MRTYRICVLPFLGSLCCAGSGTSPVREDCGSDALWDAAVDASHPVVLEGCDPFAANPMPIAFGTVLAVGESATGIIYAVDQFDGVQRVFASDASGVMVRQRITGSGSGADFLVFSVGDSDSPFVLQIDAPIGGTMRMGVLHGTLKNRKVLNIGQDGEELTVLASDSIATKAVRSLPGDIVVEYTAGLPNGDIMLVTRPRDNDSSSDFRLFLGPTDAVAERNVNRVSITNGGSIALTFDMNGTSAVASFPGRFTTDVGTSTLTAGTTETPLAQLVAPPAGASYFCFGDGHDG